MKINRREAIVWLGATAATCSTAAHAEGERVIIQGVDKYRVMEPMYEAIRVIVNKRGDNYTPAYIQGISGAAFRVAGPCPCAPICAGAMSVEELVKLLGYENDTIPWKKEMDTQKWLSEALPMIKAEVRAGRPAIVFHAFTNAEWDVVCGFDEGTKKFYGRGSYAGMKDYAVEDEGRTVTSMDICGIIGPTFIRAKTSSLDARKAEVDALKEAVRFAWSTNRDYPYYGLQCYDRWIATFAGNEPRRPDFGCDGYTSGIYGSCRHAAVDFLNEIKPRYPSAAIHIEGAAARFTTEARLLRELRVTLFPPDKPKPGAPEHGSRAQSDLAAGMLADARYEYLAGMNELEKALRSISVYA